MTTHDTHPRTSTRRFTLRKGVATLGVVTVLAVGGFGTLQPAEAQAAGVKNSNYVMAQVQHDSRAAVLPTTKGDDDR